MIDVLVIGTGPGAAACIHRLVDAGLRPTVIDPGRTLEPENREAVDRLRDSPDDWDPADVTRVKANPTLDMPGVPRKSLFGSSYFEEGDGAAAPLALERAKIHPTFARGGFSVAWGGAVLPVRAEDMQDWPIARGDLDRSYERVVSRLPLAGREDALAAAFPLYAAERLKPIRPAAEVRAFLNAIDSRLDRRYAVAGAARLAVDMDRCIRCGLCLTGCPFGLIHGFDRDIDELQRRGLVDYRPGIVASRLAEDGDGVTVDAVDLAGRPLEAISARRVFLAAGAINSARILLESRALFDHEVTLLDSQKFVVPLIHWARRRDGYDEGVALPSVFLDIRPDGPQERWVHVQISALNDYVLRRFETVLGRRRTGWRWRLAGPVIERMLVAWGGLHSDFSSGFSLRLLRPASGRERPTLRIRERPAPDAARSCRRVAWKTARKAIPAGVVFLPPAMLVAPPGGGCHVGGTLPMRRSPTAPTETDRLGRPAGWRRVHVVDASVLPSIPATTLALTIMANADRITTETFAGAA